MKLLILALLSLPAFAQPVVTGVTLEDLTHNSVRMRIASTPDGCYQVHYGVVSGSLIYKSQSTGGAAANNCYPTNSIALGGLAPGTTFYYRVHARDTVSRDCVASPSSCSMSDEASFTTLAAGIHPVMPIPPANWEPGCAIDESDYANVPVAADGSNVCRATASVSAHGWSVTNGDEFQTVLTNVGFKGRIQIAQGSVCNIPSTVLSGSHGYVPRQKTVWAGASGIDDATHPFSIIETVSNNAGDFPPCGSRIDPSYASKLATFKAVSQHSTHGNMFRWETPDGVGVHHYWLRNLRLEIDRTATYSSSWMALLAMGDENNTSGSYNSPRYNILDRLLLVGDNPAPPVDPVRCTLEGFHLYARYFSVRGNYLYDLDCSHTNGNNAGASTGIFIAEGASGPGTISNNYVAAAGLGILAENNNEGARVVDLAVEKNTVYQDWSWMWPYELVINNWDGRYRVFRQPLEFKHGDRVKIDGNIIDGAFSDQNEGPGVLITAQSNNVAGSSGNQDFSITNNVIRRAANVFTCAGVRYGDPPAGPPDHRPFQRLLIANNLAYDLGRGRGKYQGARMSAGQTDFYLLNHGCADATVRNNTFGWKDQTPYPAVQYITAFMVGSSKGSFPAEGFTWKDNIHYYNSGNYRGVHTGAAGVVSGFPMVPQALNTSSSETDITATVNAYFGTLTGAAGVTPGYTWGGNVVICGMSSSFGDTSMNALDQAACDAFHNGSPGTHPAGDIWMPGASMAAREAASGLNTTTWRVTPTASHAGHAGANIDQIRSAHGIVSRISVAPTAAGARFTYIAPDSKACYIDTSADAGTTWTTRTTDAGGSRLRSTTVTGLSASTLYSWRLHCYRAQAAAVTYDFLASHEVTTGTFTTTSSGTRVISVGFSLPSGATQARITATPAGGSQVQQTCSSSPCSMTLGARGAYTRVVEYLSAGDAVLRTSDVAYLQAP
jgi:hypothetical protein